MKKPAKRATTPKKPVVPLPIPHPPTERDFDAVDAAIFNSDVLHYSPARERVRWYLDRWEREFKNSEALFKEMEKLNAEDDE